MSSFNFQHIISSKERPFSSRQRGFVPGTGARAYGETGDRAFVSVVAMCLRGIYIRRLHRDLGGTQNLTKEGRLRGFGTDKKVGGPKFSRCHMCMTLTDTREDCDF